MDKNGFMSSKTNKFNDAVFVVVLIWHLCTREWPFGDTMQTVLDIGLSICGVLIIAKYYIFKLHLKKDDTKKTGPSKREEKQARLEAKKQRQKALREQKNNEKEM